MKRAETNLERADSDIKPELHVSASFYNHFSQKAQNFLARKNSLKTEMSMVKQPQITPAPFDFSGGPSSLKAMQLENLPKDLVES